MTWFCSIWLGSLKVIDGFGPDTPASELVDTVEETSFYILYLAAGAAVTSYVQVACFTLAAQRQSLRIRKLYFQALVRQEMAWYDTHKTGALSSRISSDIPQIQEALGDKVGSFLQFLGMFLAGFIVGFVYGWKLTLVIVAIAPLIGIGTSLLLFLSSCKRLRSSRFAFLVLVIHTHSTHALHTHVHTHSTHVHTYSHTPPTLYTHTPTLYTLACVQVVQS